MNDLTSEKLDELIALSRKRKAVSTVIAVTLILLALLLVLTAVLALPEPPGPWSGRTRPWSGWRKWPIRSRPPRKTAGRPSPGSENWTLMLSTGP